MDELLGEFLIEARENLQQASEDLMALEQRPGDALLIDSAFRAIHTLKGSVALFDFAPMGRVLHAAEDLLGAVRDGSRPMVGRDLDPMLACLAACEGWLDAIAAEGALPGDAATRSARIVQDLGMALGRADVEQPPTPPSDTAWIAALAAESRQAVEQAQAAGQPVTALRYAPRPDCFFLGDDPLALVRGVPGLIGLSLSNPGVDRDAPPEPFTCSLVIGVLSTAARADLKAVFRFVADQIEIASVPPLAPARPDAAAAPAPAPVRAGRTLRVDPADVDRLIALVGELIIAKNGLAGPGASERSTGVGGSRAEIDRLVNALHEVALRLRMMPLAQTFRRFPRLVRDTAAQLGKVVGFDMSGEAVELDKTVVDGLYEPLLHVLRNAVGHGIEAPEARIAAGKPQAGRITLSARHDNDAVVIAVTDDGAGIDAARLRSAALARGLLAPAALDAMEDGALLDLIFVPGFSTADGVSEVSGRGVGMDAVRSSVEALGGRVLVTSTPGSGSDIRFVLPRSSTVAPVLVVQAGGEPFGIPLEAVQEVARVPAGRVLRAGYGEAFVLRGRTVPLLRLDRLTARAEPGARGEEACVVVASQQGAPVGVEVDSVGERLDVLLRPPEGLLASVPGLLGTALLGDGRVLMVLDLPELMA